MKQNNKIIVFVIAAVLVLGLVTMFFLQKKEQRFNWTPRYYQDLNQPYDFALLQESLKKSYHFERYDDYVIPEKLKQQEAANSSYFFIGRYPNYSKKDAQALIDFMNNGGNVFIASNSIPDTLLQEIIQEYDCYFDLLNKRRLNSVESKTVQAAFTHPRLKDQSFSFSFKQGVKDTSTYYWPYIHRQYINCDSEYKSLVQLGFLGTDLAEAEYTNFIRMDLGQGHLYWHTNPILFSNLFLSTYNTGGMGQDYLSSVLRYLDTENLIWDHASTRPQPTQKLRPPINHSKPKTPMEYIFSQPALTWAWITLLSMTALYAFFGAKRRQRPIPIQESNRNTSLEFINTIGRLYFQQQDHKVIFEKIMQLYLSHLRERYGIVVKEMDDLTIRRIVMRSDVDYAIVHDIFERYGFLHGKLVNKNVEMSADTLNNFYALIERFYIAEEARKHQAQA